MNTLDGMTVEQLRDLAERAENAAKAQEEKANSGYVVLGKIDMWQWRVRKRDMAIQYKTLFDDRWDAAYNDALATIVKDTRADSLDHMSGILKGVAAAKRSGALK